MSKDSKQLDAKGLVKYFQDEFKTKIKKAEVRIKPAGANKKEMTQIWMTIDKSIFKDFIKHLCAYQFPHLAVVSGNDYPKEIELVYQFSLDFGKERKEISLNAAVFLPKSKPEIETICDYIPGALITEREKPDSRRLFLPDDFPKGVYPWRKNEKGMEKLIRNLHEVKK